MRVHVLAAELEALRRMSEEIGWAVGVGGVSEECGLRKWMSGAEGRG